MYSIDIKEFRRVNKMTQQGLAEYLGITQSFISNMEKGRDAVPDKYIRKILDDPNIDSSMAKGEAEEERDNVEIPREVFEKMSRLIDTVCSQQETISEQHRTIDRLILGKQCDAQLDGSVGCADAE